MNSDIRILDAWDEGEALHPLHRALILLQLARPDETIEALADLTVAERDRGLLTLRAGLFGRTFQAVASCPACAETLDLAFDLDALDSAAPEPVDATIRLGRRKAELRLPTTLDLLDMIALPPPEREAALAARLAGRPLEPDEIRIVEQALPKLDPLAEVAIDFGCPACEHRWTAPFDIAAYLWDELDDHARQLLRETDILARTYGWSEREILTLSHRRRQAYLELALEG